MFYILITRVRLKLKRLIIIKTYLKTLNHLAFIEIQIKINLIKIKQKNCLGAAFQM